MYSKPKFRITTTKYLRIWEFGIGLAHEGYETFFYLNLFKYGLKIGFMYEPWEIIDCA